MTRSRGRILSITFLFLPAILLLPFSQTAAQVPIYSEDFENGDAGWVAKDLTDTGEIFWSHATYAGDGVAWCGIDDPSFVNSPGYGNHWYQRLTKTITTASSNPGGNPGRITFDIQYDTEYGFDWVCVEVSYDNGSHWDTMDCYSGTTNGAFLSKTLNWDMYAPPPIMVRFNFQSDSNTSDKDGYSGFDSDGACRIDNVLIIDARNNSTADESTFETDLDGWVPSQALGGGGPYRLETLNPDMPSDTDQFWAAFKPDLGLHIWQFPYSQPGQPMVRLGIESPVIQIPLTDGGPLYLEFDYWRNLPAEDWVYYDLEVAIPAVEDGGTFKTDWYVWYAPSPSTGPEWRTHQWDLTDVVLYKDSGDNEVRGSLVENGATTMQIRLVGMAYHNNPSGGHQAAPLFDDVRVLVPGDLGTLAGRVVADCPTPDTPLHGVNLVAYEAGTGAVAANAVTDADGGFEMELFSADYTLSLVRPLGYSTTSDEFAVTVLPGMTVEQNYQLSCLDIAYNPRSIGYWKHQVSEATGGRGNGNGPKKKGPKGGDEDEDIVSPICDYLDLIADHFNSNALNQVVIYEPPASGLCLDKIAEASALLNLHGSQEMIDRAKQQLMALLFNAASGNVHLTEVISEDGANISQAITYCDNLIDDWEFGDHELAKDIADMINNGMMVPAGYIPLDTINIAYRQNPKATGFQLQNSPNPFNPFTKINFSLAGDSSYRLSIYDSAGKLVKSVSASGHPGSNEYVWDGTNQTGMRQGSGVYFYAIEAEGLWETNKMVLLK